MDAYTDDYLSKMLPGFEKKPALQPAPKAETPEPADQEDDSPAEPAQQLFDSIAAHISQYLSCDRHQLTVLTLWVAHTWSVKTGGTAAYLNICSPEPQSGKSTCLMLLRNLVPKPSFTTGASAGTLMKYLLTKSNHVDDNKFECTLLLDDCHHTFALSERQPIVALLNSGSNAEPCYFAAPHEYQVFGPKAFVSSSSLPRSLVSRCIPIVLRRRKPHESVSRFDPEGASKAGRKLADKLAPWINRNRRALERAAKETPSGFPSGLTPREQACAEPLINLADSVGGSWPQKARDAVSAIFKLAEGSMGVELLRDLRDLFFSQDDPEYLSTRDILSALRELEHRPWSGWGRNSGKKLGGLLHPYGIHSRSLHRESAKSYRGYLFENFKDTWERYIPPLGIDSATKNSSATDSAT